MQTSTTRAIENITKGFRGFTKPSAEAVKALVEERLKDFPATTVEIGPSKKNGKFCKKHWLLNVHWKVGVPSEEFPSEAEALAAQEAYLSQNSKGIKARTMLLKDQLCEQAERDIRKEYALKVGKQAEALASVTRSDALKSLSRM